MKLLITLLLLTPILVDAKDNKTLAVFKSDDVVTRLVQAIKKNKMEVLSQLFSTKEIAQQELSTILKCLGVPSLDKFKKNVPIYMRKRYESFRRVEYGLKIDRIMATKKLNTLRKILSESKQGKIVTLGEISKKLTQHNCINIATFTFSLQAGDTIVEIELITRKSQHGWYIQSLSSRKTRSLVIVPIPPRRGIIFDRKGIILATNKPQYSLIVRPSKVLCKTNRKHELCIQDLLKKLRVHVNLPESALNWFYVQYRYNMKHKAYSRPIILRRNLSKNEKSFVATTGKTITGISMTKAWIRHYPYSKSVSHIIGYVSPADASVKKHSTVQNKIKYAGTTYVGVTGIEKQYEKILQGRVGKRIVVRDILKGDLNSRVTSKPVPGENIYLTIDIRLQKIAGKALGKRAGAAVAIDTKTGQILALVSKPGFDANLFVNGISSTDYIKLKKDSQRPLQDRAVTGTYPPGSTIKPFFGIGGLHFNRVTPSEIIHCKGKFFLPGVKRPWRDWNVVGHGKINLGRAIMRSCDVYFYNLAHRMKIDRVTKILEMFGWGTRTGVDLPQEKIERYQVNPITRQKEWSGKYKSVGILPSRAWKARRFRKNKWERKWYPGDTINVATGQGIVTVTPLQLAAATSIIANRGKINIPHLLYALESPGSKMRIYFSPESKNNNISEYTLSKDFRASLAKRRKALGKISNKDWSTVIRGMIAVVHGWNNSGQGGTARRLIKIAGNRFKIAGKTGTAKVFIMPKGKKSKHSKLPLHSLDHALFIAFAPAYNPRVAITVIAEHGGRGGVTAATIAGQIIKAYLVDLSKK